MMLLKTTFKLGLFAGLALTAACGSSNFNGRSNGSRRNADQNPMGGPNQPPYPTGPNDTTNPSTMNPNVNIENAVAPLKAFYEGNNSGDDAQFTFYLARVKPIRDQREVEIIKSVKQKFVSQLKDQFCKCGETTEVQFMWRHIRGRAGSAHTNFEGEWLISHDVKDKSWKTSELKKVPTGPQTVFLGADTENPTFIGNPDGMGYLRTVNYNPNSNILGKVLGIPDKLLWENRDDMKLALTCEVSQCPESTRATTRLEVLHHPSMDPIE